MLGFLGPEGRQGLKQVASVGTLGLEMGLSVLVGYFAGRWLDGFFETTPYLTYFGLFAGLAAGFKALYRVAKLARAEMQR